MGDELSIMRTRTLPPNSAAALNGIWAVLLLGFVIAALYFGRTVFVPIALAALITFLLSRPVSFLEKWIGRVPSVLVCVICVFTIIAGAGWMVGHQVVDLSGKLPAYQANIERKVRSLRVPATGSLARLTSSVDAIQKEVVNAAPTAPGSPETPGRSAAKPVPTPVPVKIIEGRNTVPQLLQESAPHFSPRRVAAIAYQGPSGKRRVLSGVGAPRITNNHLPAAPAPPPKNDCRNREGLGLGEEVLLFEHFFNVADFVLDFALPLFGGASIAQIRITDGFAGLFFHRAHRPFTCSLCLILVP